GENLIAESISRHCAALRETSRLDETQSRNSETADIRYVARAVASDSASNQNRLARPHSFVAQLRALVPTDASMRELLAEQRMALARAARAFATEAAVERELERHWGDVERELRFRRAQRGEIIAVHLSPSVPPVVARAMYLQEAAR